MSKLAGIPHDLLPQIFALVGDQRGFMVKQVCREFLSVWRECRAGFPTIIHPKIIEKLTPDLAEYYISQRLPRHSPMKRACKLGEYDVVLWAHRNFCPVDSHTLFDAVEGGNIAIVKWLVKNFAMMARIPIMRACSLGHLEIAQYLKAQGFYMDIYSLKVAVWEGHLGVAEWVRSQGYVWNLETAGDKELEQLQYMRAGRYQWLMLSRCPPPDY